MPFQESIEVTTDGVIKLLNSLKSGKSPGPDALRKEDLTIDPIMTAKCLAAIFNASLRNSELPREWKMAHVAPLHKKRGPLTNLTITDPFPLLVYHASYWNTSSFTILKPP